MSVKEARYVYWLGSFRLGLIARDGGLPDDQFSLWVEGKSIALDLAVSEAHRTDWRTRQQVIWADALHRTLLRSVAY